MLFPITTLKHVAPRFTLPAQKGVMFFTANLKVSSPAVHAQNENAVIDTIVAKRESDDECG